MTPTPNPTAEQILAAELMKLWGTPAGTEPVWMPEAKALARVLRAHGRLSEGAPSEEQIERAALAIYNRGRQSAGQSPVDRLPWSPRREGVIADARAALTAAGVVPQEPSVLAGRCRTCGGEVLEGTAEDVIDFLDNPSSPDREELAQREAEEYAPGDHGAQDDFLTGWRTADRNALAAQPVKLDPEKVAEVVEGASMEWQLKFDQYRSETGDDPGPKADYIARALCEAANRGELTC